MGQLDLINDDMIQLSSSFSRSTNLELDYLDSSKLNNIFITPKFEQGLMELFNSILDENSNHRVKVVSGSPGLGKSTFALLASNAVAKANPRVVRSLIASNTNGNKKELQRLFEEFQKSRKSKLLPVFLNGYMGDIEDAFIDKLQTSMELVGLSKEFDKLLKEVAKNQISIVRKWESSFPEIYYRYCELLEQEGIELVEFEKKLKRGTASAREEFDQIYSEITGGASAVSGVKNDLITLYKKSIKLLEKNGYTGIYVVYDEFGKYLEKGIHNPSLLNVQFLQDFAEFCDRSGKGQCHLTLITHLSVSQYASKLPVTIQKEWAKIEGRFQESSFYDRSTNHYKMISMVFEKTLADSNKKLNSSWKKYVSDFSSQFDGGKLALENFLEGKDSLKTIERCYPLHPGVLALLPALSQKVAQNERTLYTFLTRDEDHSLKRYISRGLDSKNLEILSFGKLYEYFTPLIAKDTGVGGNYKIQLIFEESCSKIKKDNILGREIIALASLLSIVKDSNFAPISEELIIAMFAGDYSEKEIITEVKNLVKRKVLLLNKIKNQFELVEGSSVDIDEEINKLKRKKLASKELVKILKNYIRPTYITPNKYNFDHKIIRYYRTEILSYEEMVKLPQTFRPNFGREDGVVFYVIPFSKDELDQARSVISKSERECVAFVLPTTFVECRADLEELNAVNALFANKEIINSGPLVKKELERHRQILIESIEKIVNTVLGRTFINAKGYYPPMGDSQTLKHMCELNRFLGNVFEKVYSKSVDFNSEYANRNKISGNIALARKQVIDGLYSNRDKVNIGLEGNGPEVAVFKALKQVSKLNYSETSLDIAPRSQVGALLNDYKKLISNGITAEEIINTFIAPPYGIRKGIMPLLMASWDLSMESPVNHYHDGKFVSNVDGEHYDMIMKQPKSCTVQYTEISKIKREYVAKLGKVFGNNEVSEVQDLLTAIYSWRRSIPESSKVSEQLSSDEKKVLIYIDSAKEPDKLIFEKLPEALGFESITDKTSDSVIRKIVDRYAEEVTIIKAVYPALIKDLHSQMVEALQFIQEKCLGENPIEYSKGMNLAELWQSTLDRFQDNIKHYPYSKNTAKFLGRVKGFDSSKHQQYFIETVADALTNANPRNWDTKGKAMYEFTLTQAIQEIETVVEYMATNIGGESAIAFINKETGEKNYIRLGIMTDLNDRLNEKAHRVEDIISELSDKDRNNLLVNLLKKNAVDTKNINSSTEFGENIL